MKIRTNNIMVSHYPVPAGTLAERVSAAITAGFRGYPRLAEERLHAPGASFTGYLKLVSEGGQPRPRVARLRAMARLLQITPAEMVDTWLQAHPNSPKAAEELRLAVVQGIRKGRYARVRLTRVAKAAKAAKAARAVKAAPKAAALNGHAPPMPGGAVLKWMFDARKDVARMDHLVSVFGEGFREQIDNERSAAAAPVEQEAE